MNLAAVKYAQAAPSTATRAAHLPASAPGPAPRFDGADADAPPALRSGPSLSSIPGVLTADENDALVTRFGKPAYTAVGKAGAPLQVLGARLDLSA